MYIKVITTRTKSKAYRYVKLVEARWNGGSSTEHVIATLGTVEDVLQSKDSIIRGLQNISDEAPVRTAKKKSKKNRRRIYMIKVPGSRIHKGPTKELLISNLPLPPWGETTGQKGLTMAPAARARSSSQEHRTKRTVDIQPGRQLSQKRRPYKSRTYGKPKRSKK